MCAVASSYARLPAQNHAYIFRRRLCEWYDILNTHHMCTCWRHSYRRFHARQFSYILRPGSYETHVLLSKQLVCTFTTYCTENNVHNIMRTIFQGATLRVTLIPNKHHMCMCWVSLKKHLCKKFIIHVAGRSYEHIPCSGDNLCARSRHIVIQNSCGQCHAYIFSRVLREWHCIRENTTCACAGDVCVSGKRNVWTYTFPTKSTAGDWPV